MTKPEITKLQREALMAAAVRNDATIFPVRSKSGLNAGSTAKLVKTLIAKGLAVECVAEGKTPVWRKTDDGIRIAVVITAEGLAAIGMLPAGKAGRRSRTAGKKAPAAAKQGTVAGVSGDGPPAPRPNSKLALLVELLTREQGATLDELAQATVWQHHTVRGTLSGAITKRLGFVIKSDKTGERGRVYRASR